MIKNQLKIAEAINKRIDNLCKTYEGLPNKSLDNIGKGEAYRSGNYFAFKFNGTEITRPSLGHRKYTTSNLDLIYSINDVIDHFEKHSCEIKEIEEKHKIEQEEKDKKEYKRLKNKFG